MAIRPPSWLFAVEGDVLVERVCRLAAPRVSPIIHRMDGLRAELKGDVAELRAEFKSEIAELRTEVAEVKSEVIVVKIALAGLKPPRHLVIAR